MWFHLSAHLWSLMVGIAAMAKASCPRRALVLRSVLRRSCRKFDSHELVRSMVQRIPSNRSRSHTSPAQQACSGPGSTANPTREPRSTDSAEMPQPRPSPSHQPSKDQPSHCNNGSTPPSTKPGVVQSPTPTTPRPPAQNRALRVNVGFGVAGTGWRVMLAGVLGLGSWWGW